MLYYFAYGSNLHPYRLIERVPSAALVGAIELKEYCLGFEKHGQDGSSKCNLIHTGDASDSAYGAIYRIAAMHKQDLDTFEGKGSGYVDQKIDLRHQGERYACFTYFAQQEYIVDRLRPFHWYKDLVLHGARYLQFPPAYVAAIESVESMQDRDTLRRETHQALIGKIAEASVKQ